MRKVEELMKDLGFREDGPEEVKKAFIKNLLRAAYGVELRSSDKAENSQTVGAPHQVIQLSFDFGESAADLLENGLSSRAKSSLAATPKRVRRR